MKCMAVELKGSQWAFYLVMGLLAIFFCIVNVLWFNTTGGGMGMLISMVILIPFSDLGIVADYAGEGAGEIGFLVLQAAVASFLPYILYSVAMARIEAGTGSLLAACGEPVAAAVFGLLVFTEVPSPLMVVGMALAIGAMAVICMNPKRKGNLAAESER